MNNQELKLTEEQRKMGAVILKDKDGNREIYYPVKDGRKTVYYPSSYMQDLNSQGRVEGPIE